MRNQGISITDNSIMHNVSIRQSGVLIKSTPSREIQSILTCRRSESNIVQKKRGQIKGFSRRSAMRFKQKLICFDYSNAFEMALTSPPYAIKKPEEVLTYIHKNIKTLGDISVVWRKEVTRNGIPHYHLIVWTSLNHSYAHSKICDYWSSGLFPRSFDYTSIVDDIYQGLNPVNEEKWREETAQIGMLNLIEKGCRLCEHQYNLLPQKTLCDWCRARTLKVNEHKETNFRNIEGIGFIKYILDHTSKHKEYQAKTTGRAWGIINKASIPRSLTDDFEMSRSQFDVFLRFLGKMSRYKLPKACVFGSHLTHRKQYNSSRVWGRSAQFIDPSQVHRLVSFVLENYR